jgi:hypothetical protein
MEAEAEDHAKFVATSTASAYLLPGHENQSSFRPGSSSPHNRLKLQNRPSAPIGFTKSSMTVTG